MSEENAVPFIPVAVSGTPVPAVAAFAAIDKIRRRAVTALRKIEVPEWDMDLYFGPLVASDLMAVAERNPKSPTERDILLLVLKAKDAEGKPMFRTGDVHYLQTEVEWSILTRVVSFMYESAFASVLQAKEEIEKDPTSASA